MKESVKSGLLYALEIVKSKIESEDLEGAKRLLEAVLHDVNLELNN